MGTCGIVDLLPVGKGLVERAHIQVAVVDLIELLRMGALGPFHMAVKLGRTGRKYEETYPHLSELDQPCCQSIVFLPLRIAYSGPSRCHASFPSGTTCNPD